MVEGNGQLPNDESGSQWVHDAWAELVQRLTARRPSFDRYTVHEEVGHGGMGRVLHVRDEDLQRDLAMKVMKPDGSALGSDPSTPTMMRARFVEEAQVAGQLDHPGIVPVHDVGLDSDGQFYFTMKLVRGRTLEKVIGLAREGAEGWSQTRVLNALLRVCEAMSYAHERGVLHRDLKPANVMIGNHGEVYVMDWGLARLVGRPDRQELPRDESNSEVRSARTSGGSTAGSSLFLTQNDQVVGTPAFMSPEQAEGAGAHLTAQADVYSVGAILYMALTGVGPYCKAGQRIDNRAVWVALQAGPPKPVAELAPKVAPELASICEKAMARSLEARYPTMAELAEDLRAYLEMRVVHAHRTGPLVEFKKWVRRNKKTAAGVLVVLGIISVAGFAVAGSERERAREAELRATSESARAHEAELRADSERARAREAEFRADLGESASLLGALDGLGPIHPARVDSYNYWIERTRLLLETLPKRVAEHDDLAKLADSVTGRQPTMLEADAIRKARDIIPDMELGVQRTEDMLRGKTLTPEQDASLQSLREVMPVEIAWRRTKLAALEAALDHDSILGFADRKLQAQADEYHSLEHNLRALELALPRIQREAGLAAQLRQRTIDAEAAEWNTAIASIADVSQCPAYEGLRIVPQVGLVPLRRDPKSGLWEFWHVLTGEKPTARADGEWSVKADTGVVLVLIPGGSFLMGAQKENSADERYDPRIQPDERLLTAKLNPYFISKYEMTQGQWQALTDEQPSYAIPGKKFKSTPRNSRSNPVESVDWISCYTVLGRVSLALPTEMQWERAARGGTHASYLVSDKFEDIYSTINFSDRSAAGDTQQAKTDLDDGFANHIHVDAFGPNAFGLYNVLGNVSEWCRDWYADKEDKIELRDDGTGEIITSASSGKRSVRGGSYKHPPEQLRVSARSYELAAEGKEFIGLRPARTLDQ